MFNSRIAMCMGTLMGLCLLLTVDFAAAACGKQCKEAKNYCANWQKSNPGQTCGTVRGLVCTSKAWKKIKQVNGSWSACRLAQGEADLEKARDRCQEHAKYWGDGECEVQSPRCKAGWGKIEEYGKFSACRRLQPSGRALYDIYKAFMRKWEGKGQTPMHPALKDFIKQHYDLDVNAVRWGHVDNPHATCTTDCTNIYCKDPAVISQIQSGRVYSSVVFHELGHVEQCKKRGGRQKFAQLWFGDLPVGFFKALKPDIKDEFKDKIHDRMPMEDQAEKKAQDILAKYQAQWWHKTAKCRVYKDDRKTIVYESQGAYARVFCDPNYQGDGWKTLEREARKAAQKDGDGRYHFAFGRPDDGEGVWLKSSHIRSSKARTKTGTRKSSARPPARAAN